MQQGSFRFGEQQLGADTDDAALTGWRHNVSYLPQHFPVLDRYTVGEYLTYLAWLRGAKPTAIEQDLLPTLREVGLEGQITAHVGVLSGGMRQRLGIAQAMIGKPSLILLDEPTTGLDPRERRRFRALVESRKNEATIMMSTHLVEDAVKLADSIVVMRSGTVLHSGPPSTLLAAGDEVTADSVEVAYDRLQGIGTGAQALT
jgi:ABC-2 type transport system ATP-binding protein